MPKSTQQYMEKGIYLEFSRISSSGSVSTPENAPFLHAYVVYRDGKGGERVFRGGPELPFPLSFLGDIETQNMPLDQSKDEYTSIDKRSDRPRVKLPIPDEKIENDVKTLSEMTSRVVKAGSDYDYDQNSNSLAATLLNKIGFNMQDHIPKEVKPSQLPGMYTIIDPDAPKQPDRSIEGEIGGWPGEEDASLANGRENEPADTPTDNPHADEAIKQLGASLTQVGDDVDEALLKPDLTDDEVAGLMRSRPYLSMSDPRYQAVQNKVKTWHEDRWGTAPAKVDTAGRMVDAKQPSFPAPTFPAIPAEQPTGRPLDEALSRIARTVMDRASKTSAPTAVRELQTTLNDQDAPLARPVPMLKTDGIAGSKTRRALRFATATVGADQLLKRLGGLR